MNSEEKRREPPTGDEKPPPRPEDVRKAVHDRQVETVRQALLRGVAAKRGGA